MGAEDHKPLRNALRNGTRVELLHSEVLFIKGMPVTSIYLVVSGTLLVFSNDGAVLRRWVGPQQIVGIHDALVNGSWQGIGVAHGRVELIAFSLDSLQHALDKIPKAHRVLLDELFAEDAEV